MSGTKRTGTKRARDHGCCDHIDSSTFSIDQLRLWLLKVLPGGAQGTAGGALQPHVCLSCDSTAPNGFQEGSAECDHLVSLDPQRLELRCRKCHDYVYLECFDEALLLACQQWMQQKGPAHSCSIPSNDPGPELLTKRQRVAATPSPEPGLHRSSNDSSDTAALGTPAGAKDSDQQQQAAVLAAAAGSWEPLVAADGFPLGLRGLNNLGNTCFMNSILQVMLHAPLLRSFYLGEGHDPGSCRLTARDKPCLSCQLDTVFGEVYSGNRQPFSPADFLYQWWRFADSLAGYQQQDAHEFYLSLLEGLSGSVLALTPPPPPPSATPAAAANGADCNTNSSPAAAGQAVSATGRQRLQQQPALQDPSAALIAAGQQGQAAAQADPSSTRFGPGFDAAAQLNVLGGSMAACGQVVAAAGGGGVLGHPGMPPRQHHPPLQLATRLYHTDPTGHHQQPQQQQRQQQQQGLPGSSNMNGWPLDPQSQQQQQQQQQSGQAGDLSGYETPISSGATPEPEGDTEAASRPPDQAAGAALVDLVFSGLLRSDVRCCACGHTSTAHDPFRDISLDLHVPRPPRLPPVEPHNRRAPAGATGEAAAAAAQPAGQGAAAAAAGQQQAAEVSPAVAAAAKRLGISAPLGVCSEGDLGLREPTPPLLVLGMTPSPTPPPSDLLMEYWDNTDNERDTAAGGSRPGSARDAAAGAASAATSLSRPLSGATGQDDEGDEAEAALSTQLSREDMEDEEGEVSQHGTAAQATQHLNAATAAAAATAATGRSPRSAAMPGHTAGHDAVSTGTQACSLTPEPLSEAAAGSEDESEKSPEASEVGGPVASQSSQQVGGPRTAAHTQQRDAASPEAEPPGGDEPGALQPAAQHQHQQQQRRLHVRESTPQSQATQPVMQQQQQLQQDEGVPGQQVQAGSTAAAAPGEHHSSRQQPGPATGNSEPDAGGTMGAAAGGGGGGGGGVASSLVRGVSGGLTQLVKGPMTAIKQTAIKLLPGWAGAAGDDQQQQQQQQQLQFGAASYQVQQQQQQLPPEQLSFAEQQQQLGTFPSGGSDVCSLGQDYSMPGGHPLSQQSYGQEQQLQQPYVQQAGHYLDAWMMQSMDSSGYEAAAFSPDWLQQTHLYNSSFSGQQHGAAAAAGLGGMSTAAAAKGSKSAPPKPRQQRCGKCKYCLNRHLKKGCEMNRKLREEAKAAAKVQDRAASAAQRAAAQRAAQSIAAAAAAEDPAAAAAAPVGGAAFGGPSSAATQPTHPLGGMDVHPGAAAGAGWAHPGRSLPMYQQQFAHADFYQQPQLHQHQQQQMQPLPAAAGFHAAPHAAVAPAPAQAKAKAAPQQKAAAASGSKVGEKLVAAALTAGLLKKRDERGRFYRKEHLQVWARLLYERGQVSIHSLPPITPEAAAAAAATQDAAMAAGTADWPLPPWLQQPQETAGVPGVGGSTGGTAAAAAGKLGRPSTAAAGGKSGAQGGKASTATAKKGASGSGASLGKKAQPAVLRMNDLTLAGCLRRYVRPERLGAAAHWRCSACGSSSAALKQLSFRRLPLVLCFHLKRFEHGGAAQRPRKLDIPMRFPLHGLDMAPFTTSHMLRGLAHAQHCRPAPAPGTSTAAAAAAGAASAGECGGGVEGPSFQQSCLYELFGVVSHWGDMSSGHYVAYVKCEGAWYLLNDPWVVAVSEADVAGVQAYMLFYAQEHLFGTGSSGELGPAQLKQRADAVAAVATAAAAANVQAAAGVVKAEVGGSAAGPAPVKEGRQQACSAAATPAAAGAGSKVKVEGGL